MTGTGPASEPASTKAAAWIVGALFVTTMLAGMVDAYLVVPIVERPLVQVSQHEGRIFLGAFCVLYLALGVIGIALVMFPILRRHDETLAITYVAFRTVEGVLLAAGAVAYLVLATMGRDVPAGDAAAAARWALAVKLEAYQVAMVVLGLAGVFFCRLLGAARLVPRPLATWGVVGYALLFSSAVLDIVGVVDTAGPGALLYVPGGVWELLAFPGWLFVKGFGEDGDPDLHPSGGGPRLRMTARAASSAPCSDPPSLRAASTPFRR